MLEVLVICLLRGMPRNSVGRIFDWPDMTSTNGYVFLAFHQFVWCRFGINSVRYMPVSSPSCELFYSINCLLDDRSVTY